MKYYHHNQISQEVSGLGFIFIGLLFFLMLTSYDPNDVPSWFFLSITAHPNDVISNFLGKIGAIISSLAYFLFGAASYFGAIGIMSLGISSLFHKKKFIWMRLGWCFIFTLSWSLILDMQHFFLLDWKQRFGIPSSGGWFGHALNTVLGQDILGNIGTSICTILVCIISLLWTIGAYPLIVLRYLTHFFHHSDTAKNQEILDNHSDIKKYDSMKKILPSNNISIKSTLVNEEKKTSKTNVEPDISLKKESKINNVKIEKKDRNLFTIEDGDRFNLPSLKLLDSYQTTSTKTASEHLTKIQNIIISTLQQFGIASSAGEITEGSTITRYEFYPDSGVRVERIAALEKNIARATSSEKVNILAPIPGKETVGVEIIHKNRIKIKIKQIFETNTWKNYTAHLPIALGEDIYRNPVIADITSMPHLLVAGSTGSGKSVCINSIINSLIFRLHPSELRFVMIDPKFVELQVYNKLPHLIAPVIHDPKHVLVVLKWIIEEMNLRYRLFSELGVRNIIRYNTLINDQKHSSKKVSGTLKKKKHLPFFVIIIDELADLMQSLPEVESLIARITQMARAAGIHLIIATQTPRADIVTGIIKANIPTRIAFQVSSKIDSRIILDQNGAERLSGQGDMLYMEHGSSQLIRVQGVFLSDNEIDKVVAHYPATDHFDPTLLERIHDITEKKNI